MPERYASLKHDENIVIITLNRPERNNILCRQSIASLYSHFARIKHDPEVKGILLTGTGSCFCAGADINEMKEMTALEASDYSAKGQELMFAVESVGKPVIAAVQGFALGGGLELALSCDLILASESARFAAPEIQLGIIPGFGGTQRLPRLIGKSKAKELIFTGKRITALEAYEIGLINRIFPKESIYDEAVSLLKQICSRGGLSLRMAKEVIQAGSDIDLSNACMMERDAFAVCFTSDDQKEGMTAFIEKRPARFSGR